jgi:VWFA-related protein
MTHAGSARRARAAGALALAALCLAPARARCQEPEGEVTLRAPLVNFDVMVKDRKGAFVTDLGREDFVVEENGVPQTVDFFDPPSAGGTEAHGPGGAGAPRNVISLLLDAQTTEATEVRHVGDGALRYIRERIKGSDVVAVFTVSNGLRLLQPFTNDKVKLVAAVENGFALTASSTASERREVAEQIAHQQETLKEVGGAADLAARSNAPGPAGAAAQMQAAAA